MHFREVLIAQKIDSWVSTSDISREPARVEGGEIGGAFTSTLVSKARHKRSGATDVHTSLANDSICRNKYAFGCCG